MLLFILLTASAAMLIQAFAVNRFGRKERLVYYGYSLIAITLGIILLFELPVSNPVKWMGTMFQPLTKLILRER